MTTPESVQARAQEFLKSGPRGWGNASRFIADLRREAKETSTVYLQGSFNMEYLAPVLEAHVLAGGLTLRVRAGGYQALDHDIFSETSALAEIRPTSVVLVKTWREMEKSIRSGQSAEEFCETYLKQIQSLRDRFACPVIASNLDVPGFRSFSSRDAVDEHSLLGQVRKFNTLFANRISSLTSVSLLDLDYLAAWTGQAKWSDDRLWYVSKQHIAPSAFGRVSEEIVSMLQTLHGKAMKKAIIVDLDNTLWGGIVGDDGPSGIRVESGDAAGEAFLDFQAYLKGLKNSGMLLAISSKNDLKNVEEAFRTHLHMPLALADFAAVRVNWEAKSKNIRSLIEELNLGVDSFIFVDDNPREIEEVSQQIPELATLCLGADPAEFRNLFDRAFRLYRTSSTTEDQNRTELYAIRKQREALKESSPENGNYEDYLRSLDLKLSIELVTEKNFTRCHQLIEKTNQFNLTTERYSESRFRELLATPGTVALAARLRDKFGDNGIISVLLGRRVGTELVVNTWLMSCRVFNLRVENAFFGFFVEMNRKKIETIVGEYAPTAKNGMVAELYPSLGFKKKGELDSRVQYAAALADLSFGNHDHIELLPDAELSI